MRSALFIRLILVCTFSVLSSMPFADVPEKISYQGFLTDGSGNALDGTYNFTFRIYSVETGGTALWTEVHTGRQVSGGYFSVVLGEGTPTPVPIPADVFNQPDRWLGITVNTDDEIAPRTRLASVPYSYGVGTVNGATGGDIYGDILLRNDGGTETIHLDAWALPDGGGWLAVKNNSGTITADIRGDRGNSLGGKMTLGKYNGDTTIIIDAQETSSQGAVINLTTANLVRTVKIDAQESDQGAALALYTSSGTRTIKCDGEDGAGGGGVLSLYEPGGQLRIELDANEGTQGSSIEMFNASNVKTIELDTEYGGGSGRIVTPVLEITGGADLSEQFEVGRTPGELTPEAGMVVCIDPENAGQLKVSSTAYDPTVAGIISGAGDVAPGMLMGHQGTIADGTYPIALTGRVYCLVDASYGAVKPGDLLTTSDTPGHAMKVSNRERAYGTIIGKAMTGLEMGKGLVLVLVNLQ